LFHLRKLNSGLRAEFRYSFHHARVQFYHYDTTRGNAAELSIDMPCLQKRASELKLGFSLGRPVMGGPLW
jgi:hypothetical protein